MMDRLNRHKTGQSIAVSQAKMKPVKFGFTEVPVSGRVKVTSYQAQRQKGVPVR